MTPVKQSLTQKLKSPALAMPVTYPEGLRLGVSQVELETSQVAG